MSARSAKQRAKRRKRRLPGWDDELWNLRLAELEDFIAEKGHSRVPAKWEKNPSLGRWLAYQRHLARRGEIESDRARKLEKLGVEWVIEETRVEEQDAYTEHMLARLAAYVAEHGHNRVDRAIDPGLAYWIGRQRIYRNAGHLREYRRQRLDAAGFPWKHVDPGWEEKYARLCAFHERFGHTRVARKWEEDPALGRWVEHQRVRGRKGEIEDDQRQRLETLGFEWVCTEARVEEHDRKLNEMLARLVAFRQQHGHSSVSRKHDPDLWQWIKQQRFYLASGCLKPSRRRAMDAAGFPWVRFDPRWEENLIRLQAFHQSHGHTHVPAKYAENPSFGAWVANQRYAFKKGTLPDACQARLDAIGPGWRETDWPCNQPAKRPGRQTRCNRV